MIFGAWFEVGSLKHYIWLQAKTVTTMAMIRNYNLKTFLILPVILQTLSGFCQTPVADSLLRLLPLEKNDSIRVAMLRDIGFDYYRTDATKSARYLKEAIALAERTNNNYQLFGAWMDYGSLKIDMEQFDSAEAIFKRLLLEPFAETNARMKAGALSNLATVYLDQDKYLTAEQYYLQAIAIYEKINLESQLVNSYGNICFVYVDLKQYQNTIKYANKLYAIAKRIDDPESLVVALGFLSASYTRLGQPEKALPLLNEAMASSLQQNNPSQRFALHSDYGEYYIAVKDYDRAVFHLRKADSISRTLTNSRNRASNLALLGQAYMLNNELTKAKSVLEEGNSMLTGNGKMDERREIYFGLAEVEKRLGNTEKAYAFLQKYTAVKDSIYDITNASNIAELEIQYQTEKKEKDILQLQQDALLKSDSIKKSRTFNYILLGSFLTLLVISFLSYRNYQQKQQLQQQQIKQLENEKLLLATESILKGQEDERSRLAQDLHDGLGGMLSGVKLTLSAMKGNIILPEEGGRLFTKAFELLDSSIGEMRRVAHNMMPEALVKLGLQQALQDYCDGINESKTLQINCEFHGLEERINNSTEIIVYRIVQELLNNIIKHANAKTVLVQVIRKETELDITVEDDGIGFLKEGTNGIRGVGLKNVQSRVDYLKGELDIKSTPGKGTSVHINCSV